MSRQPWVVLLLGLAFAAASNPPGDRPPAAPSRTEPYTAPPFPEDARIITGAEDEIPGIRLPDGWAADDVPPSDLFTGEQRYFARRWLGPDAAWISPNCPTRNVPIEPRDEGPRPCGCPDRSGNTVSIYGQYETMDMWPWMANWFDPNEPFRAYAANIWNGMGPCPRLGGLTSVLHRFPKVQSHTNAQEPWHWVSDAARREMEQQELLDDLIIPLIFPTARRAQLPSINRAVYDGAQVLSILRDRWASWVFSLLSRRSRIIYELVARFATRALRLGAPTRLDHLRRNNYAGSCPQGAWFSDVIKHAGAIRQLILDGVPVYYLWKREYESLPFLADLAPPDPPQPGSPRLIPPSTPRRARRAGTPEVLSRPIISHFDTTRFMRPTTKRNGEPVLLSDEELHVLFNVDPSLSPPAMPDAPPPPPTLPEQGRADSPISLGESSDEEASSSTSPTWDTQMENLAAMGTPSLLERMSDTLDESLEGGTASSSLLDRMEPLPAVVRPPTLSDRVGNAPDLPVVTLTPAGEVPSLLDFLRTSSNRLDWELRLPAPPRHPNRVIDWVLTLEEQAELRGARGYFLRLANEQLPGQRDRLEYAFARGMGFFTAAEFPRELLVASANPSDPNVQDEGHVPRGDLDLHHVPVEYRITRDTPVNQRVLVWARGVQLVLGRPHARAALAQGGLLWRIARWAGLTFANAVDGPSNEPREYGTERVITRVVNGRPGPGVDDWLSEEEESTLRGEMVGSVESLWPDLIMFARNWWQGAWTESHEAWFVNNLRYLFDRREVGTLRVRRQWRDIIRDSDFGANGGLRFGRNGN